MIASATSIKNNLTVRDLRTGDLGQVSTVHLAAFPDSALSRLGAETVRRYYQWQLDGEPQAVGFGAFKGDKLLGYCFGGIFRGATAGFLRQNSLFLAIRLLTHPWYLTNSLFRARCVLGLRVLKRLFVRSSTKAAQDPSTIIPFHVLAIAVDPKHQGLGVGKVLMEKIEEIALDRGQKEMALTVHAENVGAIKFYERLGWEKWLVDGKWNGLMKKSLDRLPFVSILMPIRNEAAFIERSLGAVMSQDYPADCMEVIVADGMSTDQTREIISSMGARHNNLRLIENPKLTAPAALNSAFAESHGDVVIWIGGHTEIAPDYVRQCVKHLQNSGFDCVGGPIESVAETSLGQTIALAMSTPFGVGGVDFRTKPDKMIETDTVAFGAYRRSAMEKAGPLDEEIRNEDDEYNYRLRKLGGRILLAPDIHSRYYSRGSVPKLWKQYLQYGFWKVRVMQKHPAQMRLRHFAPPAFVGGLLLSALLAPLFRPARRLLGLVSAVYLVANLAASVSVARKQGWRHLPLLPIIFATLHFSYGLGFLAGLVRFWNRWDQLRITNYELRITSRTHIRNS